MKKIKFAIYSSLTILFFLFNVIAFIIPTDKTITFWIAYIFTIVAFIMEIPLWMIKFNKEDNIENKFLNISIIQISLTYLILQLIAFVIFMIYPSLEDWLAVVVCSFILAIILICIILSKISIKMIKNNEDKIKTKLNFIKSLQIEIEMIMELEIDDNNKLLLKKLYEMIQFSDPISHEQLNYLEEKILDKVNEMKIVSYKKDIINEINILLIERNKKCKIW